MADEITDLTRGVYRRLYAGFIRGQRICSVSLVAEAWFWRINAIADDFGNLDGEPALTHSATVGRRADQVTAAQVAAMVDELVQKDLVRPYFVGAERFLHIVGFVLWQPAGKNGKRVKRCPHSPWDDEEANGLIRVNPGVTSASDSDSDSDSERPAAQAGAASRRTAKPPPTAGSGIIFPIRGSQGSKATEWEMPKDLHDELAATFPELDLKRIYQGCAFKLRNGAVTKKTARGMPRFLWDWLDREMKFVRPGSGQSAAARTSGQDRQQQIIDSVFEPSEAT